MMNAKQLRTEVVRPALESIDMWSQEAENLVMGTAAQESRFKYVKQLGGGPALSIFQMEPTTYYDIWEHWICKRPEIAAQILKSIATYAQPSAERLKWDLRLGAIMCRIHYRRKPGLLPNAHDVWGMAHYWKEHYNTPLGRGNPGEFVENYRLTT